MSSIRRPDESQKGETGMARALRIARERVLLDEAQARIDAGDAIQDKDVDDWLDRFVNGEPLDDDVPMKGGRA